MPGCPPLPSICTHTGRVTHVGRSGADSSTTQKCKKRMQSAAVPAQHLRSLSTLSRADRPRVPSPPGTTLPV